LRYPNNLVAIVHDQAAANPARQSRRHFDQFHSVLGRPCNDLAGAFVEFVARTVVRKSPSCSVPPSKNSNTSSVRHLSHRWPPRRAVNVVAILHSRAVAFSTRHRLQDQSVADCVRHCAVHRRRDTLGSDRQRARRVRSTVLRGGGEAALIAPAGLVGAANRCAG
jgi:hypothetical protein